MASVRMSDRLRDELKQSIEEKFLVADPKPTMDSSLSQVILDAMLEHPAYQKASAFLQDPDIKAMATSGSSTSSLAAHLSTFRQTRVVKRVGVKGFMFNSKEQEFNIVLAMPATMHFASPYNEFMEVNLADFNPTARTKLEAEMTLKSQELLDWGTRHDEYMLAMTNLLNNCNTVGQFLAALPGAESLLKPDIVQKLNTQVKPTKDLAAEAARAAFDSSKVAPTLLAAEIVGAANGGNTSSDGAL